MAAALLNDFLGSWCELRPCDEAPDDANAHQNVLVFGQLVTDCCAAVAFASMILLGLLQCGVS